MKTMKLQELKSHIESALVILGIEFECLTEDVKPYLGESETPEDILVYVHPLTKKYQRFVVRKSKDIHDFYSLTEIFAELEDFQNGKWIDGTYKDMVYVRENPVRIIKAISEKLYLVSFYSKMELLEPLFRNIIESEKE